MAMVSVATAMAANGSMGMVTAHLRVLDEDDAADRGQQRALTQASLDPESGDNFQLFDPYLSTSCVTGTHCSLTPRAALRFPQLGLRVPHASPRPRLPGRRAAAREHLPAHHLQLRLPEGLGGEIRTGPAAGAGIQVGNPFLPMYNS